jgi:predicted O-linked N-acetylglucosamine transferase (SPINDLY family)
MSIKFAEADPHNFNPAFAPGISDEARKAVNSAFEAMATWRAETVNTSERNSERVIERMAAAARALGWPEQIVDAARTQMEAAVKMQIQTLDRMMDAWEEQLKLPNPSLAGSAMLSKLKSLPGFGSVGSWPTADASLAEFNPLKVYTQFVEQSFRAWSDAISSWDKGGRLT